MWIPMIVLGWFLLMTLVGWQVSRWDASQPAEISHSENNLSEFDDQ